MGAGAAQARGLRSAKSRGAKRIARAFSVVHERLESPSNSAGRASLPSSVRVMRLLPMRRGFPSFAPGHRLIRSRQPRPVNEGSGEAALLLHRHPRGSS